MHGGGRAREFDNAESRTVRVNVLPDRFLF